MSYEEIEDFDGDEKKVFEIVPVCAICKCEIFEIYYLHPKHGKVCEECPEFEHGGIVASN